MKPATASSFSVEGPDGGVAAQLPPVPSAYLEGEHHDLLAPLRFLHPKDGVTAIGSPPPVDRASLARALTTNNVAYGHPRAEALGARLSDPATHVVVTGQQPGLFGGPLLTLAKMAAAVRWADALEAAGKPAVAVFWVATEDHDFRETSVATLLAKSGPERVDLGDDPSPLLPVGMRAFGPPILPAVERATSIYPGDLVAERWRRMVAWYRPEARFGEAFCRFLVSILGARSPLLLDAMDTEVKRLEGPALERLIEHRHALLDAQRQAHDAISSRDLPLQVTPQDEASPLFLLRGHERRRILWRGRDRFALRGGDGKEEPVATLLDIVRQNPAVISPGVLARPAIADALLGTTLQVLGPSEMTYMAQATAAYRVLEIEAPWTTLRPQSMVLENRQEAQLAELGITLETLASGDTERMIAERLGGDTVTPTRERIAALMQELEAKIAALDPTLEGPRAKTAAQIDRALDQLAGKVASAAARRHEVWHRRLEAIRQACYPGGRGQERVLAVAHFVARHGAALGDAYLDQLELDPRTLSVVRL